MLAPSVQYTNASSATMKPAIPEATRTGVPPDLGTDQTAGPSEVRRAKKTFVEFSARANWFVPSFATSVCSTNSKVAVTDVSVCAVSWHVCPFPLHAPPQLMNCACGDATAVSVTGVPATTLALQVVAPSPQFIPAPVTVPGPETAAETVTCAGGPPSKCANTCTSPRIVMLHAPGPLQPTPHPANLEPTGLVAARETVVPSANSALHVAVQSMPAGAEATRPSPSTTPARRRMPDGRVKAGGTHTSPVPGAGQAPVPLHARDLPANVAPGSAIASRRSCGPAAGLAVQLPRQSEPALRTIPSPVVVMCSAGWPGVMLPTGGVVSPQATHSAKTIVVAVSGRTEPPAFTAQLWAA